MGKPTVEKLVAEANELAEKGSWIRSGLKTWLEIWKKATAIDLKDENLKRVRVLDRVVKASYSETYYLERGYDVVFHLWDQAFEYRECDDVEGVDVDEEDMTVLRRIIARLADAIDKHISELGKAGVEYDKLIMMLPPEDRSPVKLNTDYWALPRPAGSVGWMTEIIDVESNVVAKGAICDTRSAAITAARRLADVM